MTGLFRACAVAILGAGALSCTPRPSDAALDALFDEAERLCLEGEFEQARARLKSYLLERPEDSGAHYYLGRAYLLPAEQVFALIAQTDPRQGTAAQTANLEPLARDFRPTIVEGEFQTALRLFYRQNRKSTIDRFGPEYFEMMCYLDSARVIFMHSFVGVMSGVTPRNYRAGIERALDYVEKARAIMPDAAEVDQIGGPIRDFAASIGAN